MSESTKSIKANLLAKNVALITVKRQTTWKNTFSLLCFRK